jgi:hypothetical protein
MEERALLAPALPGAEMPAIASLDAAAAMTKRILIDIKNASGTVNAQKPQNTPVTIMISGHAQGLGPFTATGTHVWVFAPGGYADLSGMLTLTNARG